MEPFGEGISEENRHLFNDAGEYLFGKSDLPKRLLQNIEKASMTTYFHLPPSEVLFLHRKLAGLFVFLSHLNAELQLADILEKELSKI